MTPNQNLCPACITHGSLDNLCTTCSMSVHLFGETVEKLDSLFDGIVYLDAKGGYIYQSITCYYTCPINLHFINGKPNLPKNIEFITKAPPVKPIEIDTEQLTFNLPPATKRTNYN